MSLWAISTVLSIEFKSYALLGRQSGYVIIAVGKFAANCNCNLPQNCKYVCKRQAVVVQNNEEL
jgi:hypothetical protein